MESVEEIEVIWKILLELKEKVGEVDLLPGLICFRMDDNGLAIHFDDYPSWREKHFLIITDNSPIPAGSNRTVFTSPQYRGINLVEDQNGNESVTDFLLLYLPMVLSSFRAGIDNRAISFSHFAQSLDGKISTITGKSRWISCQENLVHAHRMRALCDGILIGANTLKRDLPSLTVRHVEGTDPVKIIIGNSPLNFDSVLKEYTRVILLTTSEESNHPDIYHLRIKGKKGIIHPLEVLKRLYNEGIKTVYLEGGAYTTSSFLSGGGIDFLQLYIAPILFGSGISAFTLPSIDDVNESKTFDNYHFLRMGDGMLFSGNLTDS